MATKRTPAKRAAQASQRTEVECLLDRTKEPRTGPTQADDSGGAGPAFSVVLSTDNRLAHLERAVSALRCQTYAKFEVCVVAGPTEDGTRAFLATLGDDVKVARCSVRNLSRSRNIGIALASGDVVAFIDDDAVPEPEWLAQLARSYDDARVGAAGGFVHDHVGIGFQARYVTANRLGQPREESRPTPELNLPGSARFPHLLGTNCSFRRSALLSIGGFDEQYEYFLDETDVCCRINDAGYRIVQRPDAFVHHKYAPSELRDEQRTVRHWYPIIKNRLYFGLRHARDAFSITEIVEAALAEKAFWESDVADKARAGLFSHEDVERFRREAQTALEDGLRFSLEEQRLADPALLDTHESEFRRFPRQGSARRRRTILSLDSSVSGDSDSGSNSGELLAHARRSARQGHRVHVVLRSGKGASVDYDEGLWVYDLGSEFEPGAGSDGDPLVATVQRIASRRWIDAVYCTSNARDSLIGVVDLLSGRTPPPGSTR